MISRWILEPVTVEFHLDGGYTKVFLERAKNWGMTNGENDWDIPTNSIPPDLRTIGFRFLLSRSSLAADDHDSFEKIRATYPTLQIVKYLTWILLSDTSDVLFGILVQSAIAFVFHMPKGDRF